MIAQQLSKPFVELDELKSKIEELFTLIKDSFRLLTLTILTSTKSTWNGYVTHFHNSIVFSIWNILRYTHLWEQNIISEFFWRIIFFCPISRRDALKDPSAKNRPTSWVLSLLSLLSFLIVNCALFEGNWWGYVSKEDFKHKHLNTYFFILHWYLFWQLYMQ